LSAVCDYLFDVFPNTLHLRRTSPPHATRVQVMQL